MINAIRSGKARPRPLSFVGRSSTPTASTSKAELPSFLPSPRLFSIKAPPRAPNRPRNHPAPLSILLEENEEGDDETEEGAYEHEADVEVEEEEEEENFVPRISLELDPDTVDLGSVFSSVLEKYNTDDSALRIPPPIPTRPSQPLWSIPLSPTDSLIDGLPQTPIFSEIFALLLGNSEAPPALKVQTDASALTKVLRAFPTPPATPFSPRVSSPIPQRVSSPPPPPRVSSPIPPPATTSVLNRRSRPRQPIPSETFSTFTLDEHDPFLLPPPPRHLPTLSASPTPSSESSSSPRTPPLLLSEEEEPIPPTLHLSSSRERSGRVRSPEPEWHEAVDLMFSTPTKPPIPKRPSPSPPSRSSSTSIPTSPRSILKNRLPTPQSPTPQRTNTMIRKTRNRQAIVVPPPPPAPSTPPRRSTTVQMPQSPAPSIFSNHSSSESSYSTTSSRRSQGSLPSRPAIPTELFLRQ